ncbi:MAG: GNAT family N-acetyltransferase [Pseudomonadota bacterium]
MKELSLTRVDPTEAPKLESFDDRTVYQTDEWLRFVSRTQKAEPVLAVVVDGEATVGRFAGLIIRRFGIRILGSPFPGWTTSHMGFNLRPSVSRTDALAALRNFAFRNLRCAHLEVMDRRLSVDEIKRLGYAHRVFSGLEVDLTKSEDELFAAMDPACRRSIRKGEKSEIRVEEADAASFSDEYYTQLLDVFAKQRLVPTYPKERVEALIQHLHPTGRLLLVRVRNSEGTCIATGIFPALNDTMYFWGGASDRAHQILRPNEALHWFAMRYWKARGISKYDMQGEGDFKKKFGGYEIGVPWIRMSKYPLLEYLRNKAKRMFNYKQRLFGLARK